MKNKIILIIAVVLIFGCNNKEGEPKNENRSSKSEIILDSSSGNYISVIQSDGDTSVISINGREGNALAEKRDSSLSWLLSQQHCLMMAQRYGYDFAYTGNKKSEKLYKMYRDSMDYYYNKITAKK